MSSKNKALKINWPKQAVPLSIFIYNVDHLPLIAEVRASSLDNRMSFLSALNLWIVSLWLEISVSSFLL